MGLHTRMLVLLLKRNTFLVLEELHASVCEVLFNGTSVVEACLQFELLTAEVFGV